MTSVFLLSTYAAYLAISITMTFWVARTLFTHGRAFLVDAFRGREALADSVNHLLVVGFYLLNLGYVTLNLKTHIAVDTPAEALEVLSSKVGWVMLILGLIHLGNLLAITKIRRSGILDRLVPQSPSEPAAS